MGYYFKAADTDRLSCNRLLKMATQIFQTKTTFLQDLHIVWYLILMFTNRLSGIKVSEIKIRLNFENFRCQKQWKQRKLENGSFSAKVDKGGPYRVIRTV